MILKNTNYIHEEIKYRQNLEECLLISCLPS